MFNHFFSRLKVKKDIKITEKNKQVRWLQINNNISISFNPKIWSNRKNSIAYRSKRANFISFINAIRIQFKYDSEEIGGNNLNAYITQNSASNSNTVLQDWLWLQVLFYVLHAINLNMPVKSIKWAQRNLNWRINTAHSAKSHA